MGAYNETLQFEFLKNPDPLTSQMFTSLPYHTLYTKAEHVSGPGTEFTDGSVISAVLQWNYTIQTYDYRTWWGDPFYSWEGNFTIDPAPGGHLAFGIVTGTSYYWKPWVMGL